MPSQIHKWPIREEQLKALPRNVGDLMWSGGTISTPGETIYRLLGEVCGSIELAYDRGYRVGRVGLDDAVDAIRLLIGRDNNQPWQTVTDEDVQSYIDAVKALKQRKTIRG